MYELHDKIHSRYCEDEVGSYLLYSLKGRRRALVTTQVRECPRHVPQMRDLPREREREEISLAVGQPQRRYTISRVDQQGDN